MSSNAEPGPTGPPYTGPEGPSEPPAKPKRLVLSWLAFLTLMAAAGTVGFVGGPWIIGAGIVAVISAVILGLQALEPNMFPKRRILPASYGLTNRALPPSRAYGTRFDRIARAIAAAVCFYAGISILADALNR